MMGSELSGLLGDIFLVSTTVVVLAFILAYNFRARWEQTVIGRHMMVFSVAMFAVLTQASVHILLGNYPGQTVIRPLTYAAVFAVWVWRLILFLRENHHARLHARAQINHILKEYK